MNISVVITTFNRPDYLKSSLQSAIEQSYSACEIIVIDDNSSVDYTDVLACFKEYPIRYIKLDVSSGANAARNRGVSTAKGDVVAFLDDDDIWLSHYLEAHLSAYKRGAEAIVSGFKHLGDETVVRTNEDEVVTKKSLLKGNIYCGMSGFSCKRALLKNNRFDEALPNGQDWDMYVRLFQKRVNFINISSPIFLYRFQTPDGIGRKLRKLRLDEIESRLASAKKHKEFLGERAYNNRVAQQMLFSLKHRQRPLAWLNLSIKRAGFIATLMFFLERLQNRLQIKG